MIRNNTVFVLGAGASWHYGYPTGEALVDQVVKMAEHLSDHCENRILSGQVIQYLPEYVSRRTDPRLGIAGATKAWEDIRQECQQLLSRLKTVQPLLIDHFLASNPSLRPIGKLMIAAAILECEAAVQHRGGGWYRFIVHKLLQGCRTSADLLRNNVRFVTFNYDASLEHHLFAALDATDILDRADVERFLEKDRIIHTYGCVHKGIPAQSDFVDHPTAQHLGREFNQPLNMGAEFETRKKFLDQCLASSLDLRTIDPHDKEDDPDLLARAQNWIDQARIIYILGYGFDPENNRRIGLDPCLRTGTKAVLFTNFNDIPSVTQRASKVCCGNLTSFSGRPALGDLKGRYFEKSARNVYEAFSMDFPELEDELLEDTSI